MPDGSPATSADGPRPPLPGSWSPATRTQAPALAARRAPAASVRAALRPAGRRRRPAGCASTLARRRRAHLRRAGRPGEPARPAPAGARDRPGDRVALLFDQAVHSYVAMLAVLKVDAAYVPLDAGFPADRSPTSWRTPGVRRCCRCRTCAPAWRGAAAASCLDDMAGRIGAESRTRLTDARSAGGPSTSCATSSTPRARPAGPRAWRSSTRASATSSGWRPRSTAYRPDDRVYQGMTIAFDFSVEEIWVPWAVGATLVPKPAGGSLLGVDLHAFLSEQRVTAMCCVPTLLATLEEDLPRAALPAGVRGGLPAGPDRPLAPARAGGSSTSTGPPRPPSPPPGRRSTRTGR